MSQTYHPPSIFERPWRQSVIVSLSSNQSIPNNTVTKIQFNKTVLDPFNLYEEGNDRIECPPWARFYSASAQLFYTAAAASARVSIRDYAAGGATFQNHLGSDGATVVNCAVNLWPITTSGRYLEAFAYHNAGAARNASGTSASDGEITYLSVTFYP